MKRTLGLLAMSLFLALTAVGGTRSLGAEQTWTGEISDATCGASHVKMSQGLFTAHECTLACAEKGKFVLVSDGKVLEIVNQDFAALKELAGEPVKVTGEQQKDGIVVSKISKS